MIFALTIHINCSLFFCLFFFVSSRHHIVTRNKSQSHTQSHFTHDCIDMSSNMCALCVRGCVRAYLSSFPFCVPLAISHSFTHHLSVSCSFDMIFIFILLDIYFRLSFCGCLCATYRDQFLEHTFICTIDVDKWILESKKKKKNAHC